MIGIVGRGQFVADLHELGTNDLQAFVFKARDDAAHETALNGIRLQDDQCGFHDCSKIRGEIAGGQSYPTRLKNHAIAVRAITTATAQTAKVAIRHRQGSTSGTPFRP